MQRLAVIGGKVVQHVSIRRTGSHTDNGLQVIGQRRQSLRVNNRFQHGPRFMPTRVIVIVAHFHEAQRSVVVRSHPLDRINDAGLHGGINLAPSNTNSRPTRGIKYFSRQAGNAHLQSVEICAAVQANIEPARHLHARAPAGEGDYTKGGIQLSP